MKHTKLNLCITEISLNVQLIRATWSLTSTHNMVEASLSNCYIYEKLQKNRASQEWFPKNRRNSIKY